MLSTIMNRPFHNLAVSALTALYCTGAALAGGEGWSNDFEAAKKEAESGKKDLLIDFTGSDWCGWCIKLNKEVFQHDEFKTGVKDKFVLVELDFPNDKSKLSEATQKQNAELQKKFAVRGFPTILLCDATGKPYASTGYKDGGPVKYVENLDSLREKKTKRDEAFSAAAKAQGVEKAKQLVSALKEMELSDGAVASFYGDVVAQIKEADPKDETGYVKAAEAKAKKASFEKELNGLAGKKDFDGAIALIDKTLAEGGYEGEEKQQLAMSKTMVYMQIKKYDEALKAADAAKAMAPDSPMIERIDSFKGRIEAMKKADAAKAEKSEG